MKHNFKISGILLGFFILSQLFGLFVISYDMNKVFDEKTNQTITTFSETAIGQRPDLVGVETIIFLSFAIIFGTGLVLLLARFNKQKLWKAWFFMAIWMTISITLGVFMKNNYVYLIGLLIAIWKVFRPNFFIHNFSEILIYAGIAFLLSPIFNIYWASIMLIIISIYDAFAVWQSKHMIKLAVFQRDSNLFAGLNINYDKKGIKKINTPKIATTKLTTEKNVKTKTTHMNSAVLGGGDMAFPLIFSGTILTFFFNSGLSKIQSYIYTLPVVVFSTLGLGLLLYYSKKEKFYPAMPFISAGCFIGLGLSLALHILI